jgi:hypothetical protein
MVQEGGLATIKGNNNLGSVRTLFNLQEGHQFWRAGGDMTPATAAGQPPGQVHAVS